MSIKKIILLITLSMSFNSIIISMQEPINLRISDGKLRTTSAKEMSDCIDNFAKPSGHKSQDMLLLGRWLLIQRNDITEENEWSDLVNSLGEWVTFCRCDCLRNRNTIAVRDAVKKVALTLQPGNDCTNLLITCSQEALKKTADDWSEQKKKKTFLGS
jgi:hypothetical protein